MRTILISLLVANSLHAQAIFRELNGITGSGSGIAFISGSASDLGNNGGSTSSYTHAYNVPSNATLAFACIAGDSVGGADDLTSLTLGGTAMTTVAAGNAGSTGRYLYLGWLISPPTGSQNLVAAFGSTHAIYAGVASYSGAGTSSQPDSAAHVYSPASVNPKAVSFTTTANNSWTFRCDGENNATLPPSESAGGTMRAFESSFAIWAISDSAAPVSPAGAHSMTTTDAAPTGSSGSIVISFHP